jgi:DNA-binding CsgD family transcriptional regulator
LWDPIAAEHRTLSNDGYDATLVAHFHSRAWQQALSAVGMYEAMPRRQRDVDPRKVPSIETVLWPLGFCEGLTMCLFTADGRYVGMLNLSTERRTDPSDEAREAIGLLNATLANVVDLTASLRLVAGAIGHDCVAVGLSADGGTVALPGVPSHPVLRPPSPVPLIAADHAARAGSTRFLWHAVACGDAADHGYRAIVLARQVRDVAGLTRREVDVLSLLADGRSNAEIAGELMIGDRTVGSHVERILEKLEAPTRAAAAAHAEREGLWLPPVRHASERLRHAS